MASYNITHFKEEVFDVLRDGEKVFFGNKSECVDYVLLSGEDTDTVRADNWCAEYTDFPVSKLRSERIAAAQGCGLKVSEKGIIF